MPACDGYQFEMPQQYNSTKTPWIENAPCVDFRVQRESRLTASSWVSSFLIGVTVNLIKVLRCGTSCRFLLTAALDSWSAFTAASC